MDYSELVKSYKKLESTQSTLEKTEIISKLFINSPKEDLDTLAHLIRGKAFSEWKNLDLGIGKKLIIKAISKATGIKEEKVKKEWKNKGDLGDAVEVIVKNKKQQTLTTKKLTLSLVQENLEKIAGAEGSGSQSKKISLIAELIGSAEPEEAKYIVRTVLENLRIGVGEGLVRDAIVKAFFSELIGLSELDGYEITGQQVGIDKQLLGSISEYRLNKVKEKTELIEIDLSDDGISKLWKKEGADVFITDRKKEIEDRLKGIVQHAYDVSTDFGEVAEVASKKGVQGLREMDIELFRPIRVMLAQKSDSMEDAFEAVGSEEGLAALEYKYDGIRVQIHKEGSDVKIFTRRLEEITDQFPEIVNAIKDSIDEEEVIVEGELVGFDPQKGYLPFQKLSKRIKRKYNIREMIEKIPVTVYLFDLIYCNGNSLIRQNLRIRWSKLNSLINKIDNSVELASHLETSDLDKAQSFYQKALDENQEGIMLKNLSKRYKPGSRVGYMVKLKPVMETLDLAIIGAEWGEGRRRDWLGSYKLACMNKETGELKSIGKMATGFTDEQLEELTNKLEDMIIQEDGRSVKLKPKVIVEVAYEEIQESPKYESGYALRFPRLVAERETLGTGDVDTLDRIRELYGKQS
ncbi:MAG: ATP-dependent DNA ligase CDC9 [Candidatus Methanohalarchaeum thermophilum]|uniref:DNA ligase n=1 Tax=Methanohalarchaeum thermophilum TaxID=1903181 RepID=A0A1Q6DW05_METT1|nr:MAG: ATP-dependent DNA ligase CDC9 [Candidatus Methanohalarchaeum thermophilum]